MLVLKMVLGFLLFMLYYLAAAQADCIIHIQNDAPMLTKDFGKKTLLLRKIEGNLPLKIGESINVYCPTGISLKHDYEYFIRESESVFHVTIKCESNENINYVIVDPPTFSRRDVSRSLIYLNCVHGAERLFESNKALEGCKNYTSLGIGTVLEGNRQMVIAGICFDFETLTTKYVKYLAHRSKYELTYESKNNQSEMHITDLDMPMGSLEVFFEDLKKDSFQSSFDAKQKANPLLSEQQFDFQNIVQDTQIEGDVKSFEYLLNTAWWRNLRLGSWKFFLNALQKRTETVKYIVYTGTSGILNVPSTLNCKKSETFRINGTFIVPEIIWAYLKPVKVNKHDEFVVFGYNTPFYSADNETIDCKDICNEIDWLFNENFGKIHLMPAFGIMRCCRPQDIAEQLDIFPKHRMTPILAATKLPLTTTTPQNLVFNKENELDHL